MMKLNEHPDSLYGYDYDNEDTYPIAVYDGKYLIGDESTSHENMVSVYSFLPSDKNYIDITNTEKLNNKGRLFVKQKTITFWLHNYPKSKSELNKIINEINKEASKRNLPIKITNDWEIELYARDVNTKLPYIIPISKYINATTNYTPEKYKDAEYRTLKPESKLNEYSDGIKVDGKIVSYKDKKAYPFAFYDKLEIGNAGSSHNDLNNLVHNVDYKYHGRIFTGQKVITFWEYPKNKRELYSRIADINAELKAKNINIQINDSWLIELEDVPQPNETYYQQLIPITKYIDANTNYTKEKRKDAEYRTLKPESQLKESPVALHLGNKYVPYNSTKFISFLYIDDILFWSDKLDHRDIIDKFKQKGKKQTISNAGRLFINLEVISFYHYPENKQRLFEIIKELNSRLKLRNIKIDNSWQIELKNEELIPVNNYINATTNYSNKSKYKDAEDRELSNESISIEMLKFYLTELKK